MDNFKVKLIFIIVFFSVSFIIYQCVVTLNSYKNIYSIRGEDIAEIRVSYKTDKKSILNHSQINECLNVYKEILSCNDDIEYEKKRGQYGDILSTEILLKNKKMYFITFEYYEKESVLLLEIQTKSSFEIIKKYHYTIQKYMNIKEKFLHCLE